MMDTTTVTTYRDIVRRLIQEYAGHTPSNGKIESEMINAFPPQNGYRSNHPWT